MAPTPAGMSAATSARNVGAAAEPEVGPAHTWLADALALVIASVPEPVTGEPDTENSAGTVSPTLVTVPAAAKTANVRAVVPRVGAVVFVFRHVVPPFTVP